MKRALPGMLAILVCIFTAGSTLAQTGTAAPAPPAGNSLHISPGSVIPVGLTKTVDAKKAKVGDEVETRVTQDLTSEGKVIIAKDTKIVGRVTQVQAHSKEQKESQLGIVFDHAILKGGESVPITMSIQAVVGQEPQSAPTNANGGDNAPSGGGSMTGGRGTMGGSAPPSSPAGDSSGANSGSRGSGRPQITGSTKGVIGISNLNLAQTTNATDGSILSSEKGNVKVEGGTFMLLRVSQ